MSTCRPNAWSTVLNLSWLHHLNHLINVVMDRHIISNGTHQSNGYDWGKKKQPKKHPKEIISRGTHQMNGWFWSMDLKLHCRSSLTGSAKTTVRIKKKKKRETKVASKEGLQIKMIISGGAHQMSCWIYKKGKKKKNWVRSTEVGSLNRMC